VILLKGNQTKNKIIESATELFKRKGYGSTSIEDLRVETGISKGLMYYHFKNKEDLFIACLKNETFKFITNWKGFSFLQKLDAKEKLFELADYLVESNQNSLSFSIPQFIEEIDIDKSTSFGLKDLVDQIIEPEIQIIKNIIEEGVTNNEFTNDLDTQELSTIVYSSLTSIGLLRSLNYEHTNVYKLHHKFLTLFISSIEKES
jgi:AcrR family transcriptional regulator